MAGQQVNSQDANSNGSKNIFISVTIAHIHFKMEV